MTDLAVFAGGIILIGSAIIAWACCRAGAQADMADEQIVRELAQCGWFAPPSVDCPHSDGADTL